MATVVENKKEFKETILGEVPSDWRVLKFNDVLEGFSSGSTPTRTRPDFFHGNIPWITSGELNYQRIYGTKERLTEEAVRATSLSILEPDTFLMAITGLEAAGTRGSCALVGVPSTTNQSCMALRAKEGLDILYFFYFYCHYGERLAFRYCQGTKQQSYNGQLVRILPINLPPILEQQKIAQILSSWDQAITHTKNLIDQLELRKKGLMQQLLTGKKRLKGFDGEWKENRLGTYFSERKEIGFEKLPLLSVGSNGVYPQNQSDKKDTSSKDKSKYKRICPGDIGYNTMRMWQGRSALSEMEGIVSPAYTILKPRNNANSVFFSYLFKLDEVVHRFYRNSQGMVSDTLLCKYKDFSIVKFMAPPSKEEQNAISRIIETADQEIAHLQTKLDSLEKEKKGLMQKLLTGQIRVQT